MTKQAPTVRRISGVEPGIRAKRSESESSNEDFEHFAITQLPTQERRALVAAELPLVPKHQLFDTSPPNKTIAVTPAEQSEKNGDGADDSRELRLPLRSIRKPIIAILAAVLLLLGVALILRPSRSATAPAASSGGPALSVSAPATEPVSTERSRPNASAIAAPTAITAVPQEQHESGPAPKSVPSVRSAERSKITPPSKSTASSKPQAGSALRNVVAPPDE